MHGSRMSSSNIMLAVMLSGSAMAIRLETRQTASDDLLATVPSPSPSLAQLDVSAPAPYGFTKVGSGRACAYRPNGCGGARCTLNQCIEGCQKDPKKKCSYVA